MNMRLGEGVYRELHWHQEAEWAYVLDGEVRVTALDYEGGNFIDDLKKGDLWVSKWVSLAERYLTACSISPAEFLTPCRV